METVCQTPYQVIQTPRYRRWSQAPWVWWTTVTLTGTDPAWPVPTSHGAAQAAPQEQAGRTPTVKVG